MAGERIGRHLQRDVGGGTGVRGGKSCSKRITSDSVPACIADVNTWERHAALTQENEQRHKGVAVHVEGVQPLHVLFHVTRAPLGRHQVLVGEPATRAGHHHPHSQPVQHHALRDEARDRRPRRDAKGHPVREARRAEHRDLEAGEGRVVAGPVVLRLLSVVRHPVHPLGVEGEEGPHLVDGALEVHLPEVAQAREVLLGGERGRQGRRVGGGEVAGGGPRSAAAHHAAGGVLVLRDGLVHCFRFSSLAQAHHTDPGMVLRYV